MSAHRHSAHRYVTPGWFVFGCALLAYGREAIHRFVALGAFKIDARVAPSSGLGDGHLEPRARGARECDAEPGGQDRLRAAVLRGLGLVAEEAAARRRALHAVLDGRLERLGLRADIIPKRASKISKRSAGALPDWRSAR